VATAADRLGFSSVGLSERLLLPAGPHWSNDYGLPDWPAYDAIESLTWTAAKTVGIRLRTDVIIPLFQQPIVLARRLATLDHLSSGRLDVGMGLGWLPEEFEAAGVPAADRAARFEDCVATIRACWAPDPVEHHGSYYRIPRSKVGPKPLNGTIKVFIGAVAKPAIERAARIGDGFTIGFRNWEDTITQIEWYRAAGGAGPIVARGGPMLADAEYAVPPITWTEPHIIEDLERARDICIEEFIWDLNMVGHDPGRQVDALHALAESLQLTPRGT
jgi:probable F420-dependent oxidoreductase